MQGYGLAVTTPPRGSDGMHERLQLHCVLLITSNCNLAPAAADLIREDRHLQPWAWLTELPTHVH